LSVFYKNVNREEEKCKERDEKKKNLSKIAQSALVPNIRAGAIFLGCGSEGGREIDTQFGLRKQLVLLAPTY